MTDRLCQRRRSLSPSVFTREKFLDFRRKNVEATSEQSVRSRVFPVIEGNADILSSQDHVFNHLEPLARDISNAKPDYYDGSSPTQLHPKVRDRLGSYIVPCNDTSRPLLPNHFTEVKSSKGDVSEMKRQLTQDLGNGARGMLVIQSYGHEDGCTYDGNAYTLGSTYHSGNGTLQLFATHPTRPADPHGGPQYHTTEINTWGMTGNIESFRQGATWYRNSRDLAKEYRDAAIARANATAATQAGATTKEEDEEMWDYSAIAAYGTESQQIIPFQD